MTRLAEIVAELLLFAQAITGYAPAEQPPEIIFLEQAELQQQACDNPCEIFGWYPYGSEIFLDRRLDPVRNLKARGVLLHELVHFLQQRNGAFTDESACLNWAKREQEAYRVQGAWLAQNNIFATLYSRARPPWHGVCNEKPDRNSSEPKSSELG